MQDRLIALLGPTIEAMGYELVDLEIAGYGRGRILRIYIDRPGGVTLDDCERVSHQVSGLLDVEDLIPEAYTLEVSSPGLDRILRDARDYERFTGRQVKVELRAPQNGRRRFSGRLIRFADGVVTLETDGEQHSFELAQVGKARLVPEL